MLTRRRLLTAGGAAALAACVGPGSGAPPGAGTPIPRAAAPAPGGGPPPTPLPHSAAYLAADALPTIGLRVAAVLTGPSATDPFKTPSGLAVAADGSLYVADQQNRRICKFDKDGTLVGQLGGAPGAADALQAPVDVAIAPNGWLWALDRATGNIVGFERDTVAAKFTGPGLFGPYGIAADQNAVYVADTGSGRVLSFTPAGEVNGILLKRGDDNAAREPTGIGFDADGSVLIVDGALNRLTRVSVDGKVLGRFDAVVQGMARIVRMPDGTLLMTDSNRGRLLRWDREGKLLARYGTSGVGEGQFRIPSALALDPDGSLYVSDVNLHRVQKVTLE